MKRLFLTTAPVLATADAMGAETATITEPQAGYGYSGRPLVNHTQFGRLALRVVANKKFTKLDANGKKVGDEIDTGATGLVMFEKPTQTEIAAGNVGTIGSDNPMDALVGFLSYMDKNPEAYVDPYGFDIDPEAAKACLAQATADAKAGKAITQTPPEGVVLELIAQVFYNKPRLVCKPLASFAKGAKKATGTAKVFNTLA